MFRGKPPLDYPCRPKLADLTMFSSRTIFITVCLLGSSLGFARAGGFFEQLISIQKSPIDENVFEDLDPIIQEQLSPLRKRMIKFGQNFIYDENLDQDCLNSYLRIMAGIEELQPWAFRCE